MSAPTPWSDERKEQLRSLIAAGHSARDLEPILGMSRKVILAVASRYNLGPWKTTVGVAPIDLSHIPADFAERWKTTSRDELAEHYGKAATTITTWCRRLNLRRANGAKIGRIATPMPSNFALTHVDKSIRDLADQYAVSKETVARWLNELGDKRVRFRQPGRFDRPNAYLTLNVNRPHRDASGAGLAADYLRRFGPITRCNAKGGYDPAGCFWRRGKAILTAGEIIERAVRNGWAPVDLGVAA